MKTSEVLNKAADLIEERGWTQGPLGWDATGPLCALGGIGAALDCRTIGDTYCMWELAETPEVAAVADYLGVAVGPEGGGVYNWNDAPGRTAAEVVEVLRAAAIVEAAKETPAFPSVEQRMADIHARLMQVGAVS